jgi:hypothetical protein
MANTKTNDKETKALLKEEQKAIEAKRKENGKPEWQPADGAGTMPETVWKKFNPTTK